MAETIAISRDSEVLCSDGGDCTVSLAPPILGSVRSEL